MATQSRGWASSKIEIPLPTYPRYKPGSGPPPPVISLLPAGGPSAFIVDKLVIPPPATALGKNERRLLHYVIGWTDLPTTQLSVPCSEALDFVSPREVERWEYSDLLRREEEKHQEGIKKESRGAVKRGKRPGKGPKARSQDVRAPTPVLEPEDELETLIAPKKAAGPSLSTPQKRKLDELLQDETEAGDTGGYDPDSEAIFRQLYGSDFAEGPSGDDFGMEAEYDSGGQPGVVIYSSTADDEEDSRASSVIPALKPLPMRQSSPLRLDPLRPSPLPSSLDSQPLPRFSDAAAAKRTEASPVNSKPIVNAFDLLRDPSRKNGVSKGTNGTTNRMASSQSNGTLHSQQSRLGFTPLEPLKSRPSSLSESRGPATPSPSAANPVEKVRSTSASSRGSRGNSPKSAPKERKRRKKVKVEVLPEEDDDSYEVKALLDDKHDYDEAGNLVRYYQVLWVGDWPAWQNPSWEPEENISYELKEEYMKKKESKMKNGYLTDTSPRKAPKKSQPPQWMPQKRYSTVAEAFEGDIDAVLAQGADEHAVDDEGDDEVLLVTEDNG